MMYGFWFILSIDLVSVTFYTIPTYVSFSKKKFLKFEYIYGFMYRLQQHVIN